MTPTPFSSPATRRAACASSVVLIAAALTSAAPARAQDLDPVTPALHPDLSAFSAMIGNTYRGLGADEDGDGAPDADLTPDIQVWDAALGGNAVRIRHTIADASYGGETLIYPDTAQGLAYVYVTTAGFRTEGSITVADDGSWTATEDVIGHDEIIRVRSVGTIHADGSLSAVSDYELATGEWRRGRATDYALAPGAQLNWPPAPAAVAQTASAEPPGSETGAEATE